MDRVQSLLDTEETSNSDQGTSGQSSTLNRGGRPQNWFRKTHFKDLPDAQGNHNRKVLACKSCGDKVESRISYLQKHCLVDCKVITAVQRRECERQIAEDTVPVKRPATGLSRSSIKKQEADVGQYMHPKVPKQQQAVLNRKMFLMFCMNGISFHVADSPYFLDFVLSLNKSFKPAGASTLRTTLLLQESMSVKAEILEKLEGQQNITVNIDSWTDNQGHSVYTCNIVFSDRQIAQWACEDLSADSHTGEYLKDLMLKWLGEIGAKRVGGLVTDNAANIRLARELTVATEGFTHILEMRCMMHAFSLTVGSLLGHPWAKELVKRAQRLVSYMQASTRAYHKLLEGARSLGIKGRLKSSNKTRFTSIQMMLESVVGLEAAFGFLLNNHGSVIQAADIAPIIRDRVFWASAEVLNKILVPFSKVMMAIQAKTATLADITRYWLYLARVLREELPKVAAAGDFMSHCIGAFNKRCKEMNLLECRLALFLDPRYKAAADAPGTFSDLVVTAVRIMQMRNYSALECQQLVNELQAYKSSSPPFNAPLGNLSTFQAKLWWQGIGARLTIVHLAIFLYDIVPHAATVERLFSLMGWYHSDRRNRLGVDSTGSLTSIKTFYEQKPPRNAVQACTVQAAIEDVICLDDGNGEPYALEHDESLGDVELHVEDMATADDLEHTLNPFYITDKELFMRAQDPTVSFTELLLGDAATGFSLEDPVLSEAYVPADPSSVPMGGLGAAVGASFDPYALVSSALQAQVSGL